MEPEMKKTFIAIAAAAGLASSSAYATSSEVPTKSKTLHDAGISKQDASEFERLSMV
jgi:hypothetical protein